MSFRYTIMANKIRLKDKIIDVLIDNDNKLDIENKIISKYPEIFEIKKLQNDGEKAGYIALGREINSTISRYEGILFVINRNEKPQTYSLIDDKPDIDDIIECITEEDLDIGYVYILDTHSLDENGKRVYKIGKANDIEKRVHQLNSEQSAARKYTVLYSFKVKRPYKVEHAIHSIMDEARFNPKKEMFYGDYIESNINLIKSMIKVFEIED